MLILGDVHLGGGSSLGKMIPGQPINSRVKDQLDILDWVLTQAIKNKQSEIVITGDVFDDPKPSHILINLFIQWCKRVAEKNIDIHIIAGNHDLLRYGNDYYSPLDILSHTDCVSVYKEEKIVDIGKFSVLFYPFRDRKSYRADTTSAALTIVADVLKSSLKPKKKNVVIGHFAIEGSVYYDEVKDITNELLIPISFFDGYDYAIMGHIHSPQKFSDSVQLIGSMDINTFGEMDHKKHIIILEETKYKEIPIPTRTLNKVVLNIPESVEDTTQYLLDNLKSNKDLNNSITKLEINIENSLAKNIDRKVIEEYLQSQGVHNICSLSETKSKEITKRKDIEIGFDVSLNSAIKKYAERFKEDEIKNSFMKVSFEIIKKMQEKS